MIPTSSAIADAGCCWKFDVGPSKYYRYSKEHETCMSAFENTILHSNSKVYDVQNTVDRLNIYSEHTKDVNF